ncbi:thermonuclease family protein [Methylobacterium marchantiae]|uniref:Thermonuclease family protein n=1 Tax=Methylobacterium marchantiae TaxID=600331 RepID=A0ABW3WU77_9HYPH
MSEGVEAPAIVAARAARESVRVLIEAEIRRQDAFPVARRTLQLLAEAVVEPAAAPPFYRIVDRSGTPREGENGPLTLEELFAELRERHGALFVPVPPKPVVEPLPEPTTSEEIKAATARFVETQSELARSVMARSAARGRAAATAVSATWSETLSGVRHQFADRQSRIPGSGAQLTLRERGIRIGAGFGDKARATIGIARERLSTFTGSTRSSFPETPLQGSQPTGAPRMSGLLARAGNGLRRLRPDEGHVLTRPSTLAGAGLLGGLVVVLVLANSGGDDRPTIAPDAELPRQEARTPDSTPAPAPAPPQQAPSQPSTLVNPRETVSPANPPGMPVEEPSPPSAEEVPTKPPEPSNAVTGKTEVIDTATLRVGGKLVRLFGVEWVRGGQPEELTRYLAGRPVTCQTVAGSEAYLCSVEGRDLSEVVLFNGGGRASSEATPDLVAAEDRARTERLGVWAR